VTIARAQFDGYDVELDTTGRSYGLSRGACFVRTGPYVRGLRNLIDDGTLHGPEGQWHHVPIPVIRQIRKWATDLGYIV
jgi:hypothetical protein